MDMMNYIIWKYFYRKTWRNPVISHDFRWKSQFFPKIHQKFAYSNLINYLKKSNGPIFFFFSFFNSTWLVLRLCQFSSQSSISCRDLRGGGPNQPPPPPMDSSPRNNPMGIGLNMMQSWYANIHVNMWTKGFGTWSDIELVTNVAAIKSGIIVKYFFGLVMTLLAKFWMILSFLNWWFSWNSKYTTCKVKQYF